MKETLDQIVKRAQNGDPSAFHSLYEAYSRRIYNFIFRMVDSKEEAEDLTQDTFLKAYSEIGRLNDSRRFESWLYRIARNEVYQKYRKRRWDEVAMEDGGKLSPGNVLRAPGDPLHEILREELGAVIESVLSGLPIKLREVFILSVMHKLPYEEIAEIVGRSLPSVKTDIYRARLIAKAQISDYLKKR